jgi:catechol 2,3-dioxygenase-like lactoylglutathione lyase family enzyme
MDMKIELIPLPSKDLAESKKFYMDVMGFNLDHDVEPGIGTEDVAPVKGIHLVVPNIEAAHSELASKGLEIGEVRDMGGVKYAFFSDPAGNGWELQQVYTASS